MSSERPGASNWVPARPDLGSLATAVHDCRGCELWADATQAVFSTGKPGSRLMLVGEQPGDREDVEGEPFVGPAGRLLDEALLAAGVPVENVYVTNAVKHFRFQQRGKRRIHQKPEVAHVVACNPWLEAEFEVVAPGIVVALGATAGRAVFGRPVRIGAERGTVIDTGAIPALLTTHPSAVLRLKGKPGYDEAFEQFVHDLATAAAS